MVGEKGEVQVKVGWEPAAKSIAGFHELVKPAVGGAAHTGSHKGLDGR